MAASSSPLGIAIVGTGFGQKVHLPAFKACPETEVVAVHHRDLSKAQAIAAQHAIPHAFDHLEQLLALPTVEAISLSTPPFLHYEMAKTVLQAGKHLLLEKPVTLTAAESRELYDLAQARQLVTAVNFEFRYVPTWMRLKELLQEGYIGRPRLIRIDWLVSGRADSSRPYSWHCSQAQGGGALGALASHSFDYIAWLFGPVKRLCARLSVTIPTRPDPLTGQPLAVDADDTCNLLLELENGIPCNLSISFSTYRGRGHWLEVYGDRGTLILGNPNQDDYIHGFELWGSQASRSLEILPIPNRLEFEQTFPDGRIAPTLRVIDTWVENIRRGTELAPTLQEGIYSQLLMDLSRESDLNHAWVAVPNLVDNLSRYSQT